MENTNRVTLFFYVLLILIFSVINSNEARASVDRPNSFAFKLGYHSYPSSDYFNNLQSSGYGEVSDYNGASIELLSYDYRFSNDWSVDVDFLSGYSTEVKKSGAKSTVTVSYLTFTPKYYFKKGDNEVYGGIGLGAYFTDLKIETGITGEEKPSTLGLNLLLGWEIRLNKLAGLLIEDKIIFGKVSTSIGDLNLGGNNLLFGIRFHF